MSIKVTSARTDDGFIQSRREPPYLVFSTSKTTRTRASDFLQEQPVANTCLRGVIGLRFRHRLHIPLRLQLRAVDLASGARIHSLHLEDFRLKEKMLQHILGNDQPGCAEWRDGGLPNRRLPKSAYAFFSAAVFHLRS